jgi:hypothetical protein
LIKPVPTSAAVKLTPKVMLTHNFFTHLRTIDMDTETTGAENAVSVEVPRKSVRLSPIMMTYTINLI